MDELDMLLSIIENPTRRRILEALVREPHYPLQLSKELGLSQQGIMKHLKLLEEYDLVRSFIEESDQGGPLRRRYFPTTGFSIVVDIGPGLFNTEIVTRPIEEHTEGLNGDRQGFDARLMSLREEVAQLDKELEELRQKRTALIARKEDSLDEAGRIVETAYSDYQSRRVVFEYVQRPDLDPKDIARALGIRDDVVLDILRDLRA